MFEQMLNSYAQFAVKVGVNVQKGQTLIINAPIDGAAFARLCAQAAFEAGARDVVVHYGDEKLSRIKMQQADVEALEDVKPWVQNAYLEYIKAQGGACLLSISSRDPEIYKGIDPKKIERANSARMAAMQEYRTYTMADKIQWCVVAIPSESWAKKVFAQCGEEEAVQKLWNAIFDATRVSGGNPVAEWREHIEKLSKRRNRLNELALDRLHLKSANGTDVVIGLAEQAQFEGANSLTPQGYSFIANIPTEEVFTAPHKNRVDGIVYGTKPYVYNGNLIENFWVRFEGGKVVEHGAEKGAELFKLLLETDEGASRIGEIALVSNSSPINKTGILFYNTLFDENAACHIAFGAGYPTTVKGGGDMTREQLADMGVNYSIIHDDVMIGSADMAVTGYNKAGDAFEIFKNGEWAF